jgi:hypothetical protein
MRPKRVLNEVTEEGIKSLIDLKKIARCLAELDATEYIKAELKLMEFAIPKKSSVQQDITTQQKDDAEKLIERMADNFN